MPARTGAVHVVTTTRVYKDRVYRTHLLRRSYREDDTVKNETLGNLSHLPEPLIDIIRRSLRGETFVPLAQAFEISRSRAHGHVQAVALAMQRLGLASLLASKPSRERDLVLAMVASRIIDPATKLATTRLWHTTTLAEDFGVLDADENDLYAAMDWLLAHQDAIQKKLAARHLSQGGLVLYDLSSSYFEGTTCPLGKLGYNRDGKKGLLQVNYGLLTDARGCPVAVSVHEGNTADSRTFMPAVHKLREDFGIERLVMVGDRGMVSHKAIEEMRETDGIGWTTALKSVSIRALVEQGQLQMDLFDQRNLLELSSPDYPGERLVACRNEALAKLRAHKRQALLVATEGALDKIKLRVDAGKLRGAGQDRPAGGQDHQQVQGGQALRAEHRRRGCVLGAQERQHRQRGSTGRPVHHSHLGAGCTDGRARMRAQLQIVGQRGARLPLTEDNRLEGAADPPPNGRPGACAHLPVHAGLLRGMAPARGLARVDVRRHRQPSQGHTRPRGTGQAIRLGTDKGHHPRPHR